MIVLLNLSRQASLPISLLIDRPAFFVELTNHNGER